MDNKTFAKIKIVQLKAHNAWSYCLEVYNEID